MLCSPPQQAWWQGRDSRWRGRPRSPGQTCRAWNQHHTANTSERDLDGLRGQLAGRASTAWAGRGPQGGQHVHACMHTATRCQHVKACFARFAHLQAARGVAVEALVSKPCCTAHALQQFGVGVESWDQRVSTAPAAHPAALHARGAKCGLAGLALHKPRQVKRVGQHGQLAVLAR